MIMYGRKLTQHSKLQDILWYDTNKGYFTSGYSRIWYCRILIQNSALRDIVLYDSDKGYFIQKTLLQDKS